MRECTATAAKWNIEITGNPVFSRDGTFSGFYGIARDVTCENPHEATYPACVPGYGSLLEQAGDAIFVIDVQTGMILDANQKALALVNRTLPEIQSMRASALHPGGEELFGYRTVPAAQPEDSAVFEEVVVDRDGNRIPVIVSTKMLMVGDTQIRIGIYHDISDLRAIQETLQGEDRELDRFFTTGPDLLCIIDAEAGF